MKAASEASPPMAFEFFLNIWSVTPVERAATTTDAARLRRQESGGHHRRHSKRSARRAVSAPLIDISQVAHVVTTMTDFRNDYVPLPMQQTNLWDDPSLDVVAVPVDTEPADIMSPIRSKPRTIGFQNVVIEEVDDPSEASFESASSVSGLFRPPPAVPEVVLPKTNGRLAKVKPPTSAVATPTALKHGGVVYSPVFRDPREWTWAAKLLLALHEPLRHSLHVMDRFLASAHASHTGLDQHAGQAIRHSLAERRRTTASIAAATALEARVTTFFNWFKTHFVDFLTCQHSIKTGVLHPLVGLKVDIKHDILARYRDVFLQLEQIQQLERALCVRGACGLSAWRRRLDVLRREVHQLHEALHETLELEDRSLHTALSNAFTEQTFVRYVMPRVFRSIRNKRVVVPWVVERAKMWGGLEEYERVQALLPFSARLLYRKIWRQYFLTNVQVAIKNLHDYGDVDSSVSVSTTSGGAAATAAAAVAVAAASGDSCRVQ